MFGFSRLAGGGRRVYSRSPLEKLEELI